MRDMCLISPVRTCISVYGRLAAAAGLMEIVMDHKFLMGLAGLPELPAGGPPPPTLLDLTSMAAQAHLVTEAQMGAEAHLVK